MRLWVEEQAAYDSANGVWTDSPARQLHGLHRGRVDVEPVRRDSERYVIEPDDAIALFWIKEPRRFCTRLGVCHFVRLY